MVMQYALQPSSIKFSGSIKKLGNSSMTSWQAATFRLGGRFKSKNSSLFIFDTQGSWKGSGTGGWIPILVYRYRFPFQSHFHSYSRNVQWQLACCMLHVACCTACCFICIRGRRQMVEIVFGCR